MLLKYYADNLPKNVVIQMFYVFDPSARHGGKHNVSPHNRFLSVLSQCSHICHECSIRNKDMFILFYSIHQHTKCQHAKTVNKWERRPCCTSSIKLSRTMIHSDMLRNHYFHALEKKHTIHIQFFILKFSWRPYSFSFKTGSTTHVWNISLFCQNTK